MDKFRPPPPPTKEQEADQDLKKILTTSTDHLNTNYSTNTKWGTLPGTKLRRPSTGSMNNLANINNGSNGNVHSYRHSVHLETTGYVEGDDEILESLVRTTTQQPLRTNERSRRKARYGDRKSCKCFCFQN